MSETEALSKRAELLREEFDASFAERPSDAGSERLDFLIVTTGADRYALSLSEVASVHAERKVTRVLSPLPELLGLADFRGVLTPIYATAALLGRPTAEPPGLLVVAQNTRPIGFAFTALEHHLRITASDLSVDDVADDPFTRGAVRLEGSMLRILQLSSLVDHLARRLESPSHERT